MRDRLKELLAWGVRRGGYNGEPPVKTERERGNEDAVHQWRVPDAEAGHLLRRPARAGPLRVSVPPSGREVVPPHGERRYARGADLRGDFGGGSRRLAYPFLPGGRAYG